MKYFVLFFLMMTCLLVLPVGNSYACGSKHKISKTEIKHSSHKKDFCVTSDHQNQALRRKCVAIVAMDPAAVVLMDLRCLH